MFGPLPPDPVAVSALEFDVLAEHLGIEALPLVLKVDSPGRTDVERARLVATAWAGLAARGLGTPDDLDDRLHRWLRLLDRPDREVDGRLWVGEPVRVLAAASGDDAVLAVLAGDRLTLAAADSTGLPRCALTALPPAPAGPGASVTLRTVDFEAAATAPGPFTAALRARGVRDGDAVALGEMIGEVRGHGRFGAARRDRWGRRERVDRIVSHFDTADGRYLQVRRTNPDGDAWTTISPATPRRLLQHVTELLD